MNTYNRGTAINLVQRFWTIDPLTQASVLADPTAVTFTILSPNNVDQVFVFGVDLNVTHPAVGIFICALDPQLPVGSYRYRCDGTGVVEASSEDIFDVIESGVLPPDPPLVAVDGPCASWINGDDVANQGPPIDGIGEEHWKLDDVAYDASSLLYALSGRQYPGVCETTVRPCSPACSYWGFSTWGSPFYWTFSYFGGGWGWQDRDTGGLACGCQAESFVALGGYPVREILEVKIGGVVLPEFDPISGARNWRLDGRKNLVRMDAPVPPGDPVVHAWPACQNISLDDDQPGTFSIRYTHGADPPSLGRAAAVQLARELWAAMQTGKCALPAKATRVVRQGITVERITPLATLLRQGATGLTLVDAFIAKSNPIGMIRRPAVYSPDVQQYARKVGQ